MSRKRTLTWHLSIGIRNPRVNLEKFVAAAQVLNQYEKEITARIENVALRDTYIYITDKDYDIIVIDMKKIVIGKDMDMCPPIFLFGEGVLVSMFRSERSRKADEKAEAERKAKAAELKLKRTDSEPEDNREPEEKNGED